MRMKSEAEIAEYIASRLATMPWPVSKSLSTPQASAQFTLKHYLSKYGLFLGPDMKLRTRSGHSIGVVISTEWHGQDLIWIYEQNGRFVANIINSRELT
jgi:hypothetical protein